MNTTCTICSEDLFSGENERSIFSTICGHIYHRQCILEWMVRSKTCPICRANLEHKNLIKLNFSYGETTTKTIADSKKRVEQLTTANSNLKTKSRVNRPEIRKLVQNKDYVNSPAFEQQMRNKIRQLLQSEWNLKNQLAVKTETLRELEENHISAILACEELRTKNMKLEDCLRWLLLEKNTILKQTEKTNSAELKPDKNDKILYSMIHFGFGAGLLMLVFLFLKHMKLSPFTIKLHSDATT